MAITGHHNSCMAALVITLYCEPFGIASVSDNAIQLEHAKSVLPATCKCLHSRENTKNNFCWSPVCNTALAQKNLIQTYMCMVCTHKVFYSCLWATYPNALFSPVLLETIYVMTIKIDQVWCSFSTSQREDNDMQQKTVSWALQGHMENNKQPIAGKELHH